MKPESPLTINTEQHLYVMACGSGFSCYGFEVLDRKARAVAAWLRSEPRYTGGFFSDITAKPGTPDHFAQCDEMLTRGAEHNRLTGSRCPADLCPALVGLEGKRVEVTTPDGNRSRFYVGKSTGWMPCHLEIKTRHSHGGAAAYVPDGSRVREVAP